MVHPFRLRQVAHSVLPKMHGKSTQYIWDACLLRTFRRHLSLQFALDTFKEETNKNATDKDLNLIRLPPEEVLSKNMKEIPVDSFYREYLPVIHAQAVSGDINYDYRLLKRIQEWGIKTSEGYGSTNK